MLVVERLEEEEEQERAKPARCARRVGPARYEAGLLLCGARSTLVPPTRRRPAGAERREGGTTSKGSRSRASSLSASRSSSGPSGATDSKGRGGRGDRPSGRGEEGARESKERGGELELARPASLSTTLARPAAWTRAQLHTTSSSTAAQLARAPCACIAPYRPPRSTLVGSQLPFRAYLASGAFDQASPGPAGLSQGDEPRRGGFRGVRGGGRAGLVFISGRSSGSSAGLGRDSQSAARSPEGTSSEGRPARGLVRCEQGALSSSTFPTSRPSCWSRLVSPQDQPRDALPLPERQRERPATLALACSCRPSAVTYCRPSPHRLRPSQRSRGAIARCAPSAGSRAALKRSQQARAGLEKGAAGDGSSVRERPRRLDARPAFPSERLPHLLPLLIAPLQLAFASRSSSRLARALVPPRCRRHRDSPSLALAPLLRPRRSSTRPSTPTPCRLNPTLQPASRRSARRRRSTTSRRRTSACSTRTAALRCGGRSRCSSRQSSSSASTFSREAPKPRVTSPRCVGRLVVCVVAHAPPPRADPVELAALCQPDAARHRLVPPLLDSVLVLSDGASLPVRSRDERPS